MNTNTITVTKNVETARFITHGGIFHADEVMASIALSTLYGDIEVARVFKVPEDTNAFVYDIGLGTYDHHQAGGNGRRENGVPYAAFGLVWRDFGDRILAAYGCPEELIADAKKRVDEEFVQPIDGLDNGYARTTGEAAYRSLELSQVISFMNPNWDSKETSDDAFERACAFASIAFEVAVASAISAVKATGVVREAIAASKNGIMELPFFVPWQEPLFADETGAADELLYVVFPSNRGGYNVQCVPVAPGSFECRKAFPEAWRGTPKESGVEGCTFVHPNGFLAACADRESAFELAARAVAIERPKALPKDETETPKTVNETPKESDAEEDDFEDDFDDEFEDDFEDGFEDD